MTLKAFIPPSLIVHPVRYFHTDIGGGILGSRERFFVCPTLPVIAGGYYNDATMNAMIAICCVLHGGRVSNHPCRSRGYARVCDCKALRTHELEMCVYTLLCATDYTTPDWCLNLVPPLLLWATTVIGLYRAICWLPR